MIQVWVISVHLSWHHPNHILVLSSLIWILNISVYLYPRDFSFMFLNLPFYPFIHLVHLWYWHKAYFVISILLYAMHRDWSCKCVSQEYYECMHHCAGMYSPILTPNLCYLMVQSHYTLLLRRTVQPSKTCCYSHIHCHHLTI